MMKTSNVPPRMTPYAGRRDRLYLRRDEIERLIEAAQSSGRQRQRNATLIYMMFRHGLRVSEAISLTWQQVDFHTARLFVRRKKNGKPSVQTLSDKEAHALRTLKQSSHQDAQLIFHSSTGKGIGRSAVYKIIQNAGEKAKLDISPNTHTMRHSCGYHLINVRKIDPRRIQDYLGHKDIRHTVRYTELDETKFDGIWED